MPEQGWPVSPTLREKAPWQPSVSALRLGGEGVYIGEESDVWQMYAGGQLNTCLSHNAAKLLTHYSPHQLRVFTKKRYIKCCFSSPPVMVPIMSLRSLNRQMISYVMLHHHLQSLLNKYSD